MRNWFARVVPVLVTAVGMVVYWGAGGHRPQTAVLEVAPPEPPTDLEAAEASAYDLIIDYRDDVTQHVLEATPWHEEPISQYTQIDKLYRIRFEDEVTAREAARILGANPEVESIDWDVPASIPPDEMLHLHAAPNVACDTPSESELEDQHQGFPNDPCYGYQWHLRQIGLPDAWKKGQGEGVIVAVIDTGVTQVPDLAEIELVPGYNFVSDNPNAADDHGHGTHVAGTIAQATNNKLGVAGVAFGAKIMPLKVLSAQGSGSMAAISQAIRFAADNGARVINMSLGGPFPVSSIRSAVKYAREKGVIVIAAAGNDGRGRVSYPAKYPEVLAVAATQFDESTTFYSNWGRDVDIAAPGGNVRVDQNGDGKPDGVLQNTVTPGNIGKTDYLWFMGTSMASPHAAGVAALIAGAGVNTPDAIASVLQSTARRPKTLVTTADGRVSDRYGSGIIDANAALNKVHLAREGGALGLGLSLALLGLVGLYRQQRLNFAWSSVGGFVAGASGLFFLRWLIDLPSWLSFLTVGLPHMVPATFGGFALGSPLFLSAILPTVALSLLWGIPRARPILGGLFFGVAGALGIVALTNTIDVAFIPDALDRAWLLFHTALCVLLGRATLRR